MQRGLGDEDSVVDPDRGVEGRVVETTADRFRLRGGEPARVGPRGRSRGPAGQEALDAPHEGVEGGAGVALAKVCRREPADEAVDAEAAHGLVTEAEAGVGVAAHDQAPAPHDLAILIDSESA